MDVLKTRQRVAGEQLAVTTGYDRKGVPAFRSPRKSREAGKGFETFAVSLACLPSQPLESFFRANLNVKTKLTRRLVPAMNN